MSLELPDESANDNERTLSLIHKERQTGVVGTALTLEEWPVEATLMLFKNGLLLDPATAYTVDGKTITLTAAAIAGDVFQAAYHFRGV